MGRWHSKKIVDESKKNFEKAWLETSKLLGKGDSSRYSAADKPVGKSHAIFNTIQKLREAYLRMGFEEVVNPLFIEDKEIKRQFGPEANAILDRCYYIGGLPRPDIGLSEEKIEKIKEMGGKVERDKLQGILHYYKKGEISGDDLIYRLAESLKVSDSTAARILDEVFSEFKDLKPEATRITLRSHMTSGWFLTLSKLVGKKPLPLRLFSVDRCFRREQKEDETHLRTHHSASCVVMGEDIGVEDGKGVAEALLKQFEFTDLKFKLDEKRSKYYAPNTQTEVYAYNERTGWVEVATFGMYSPVALSKYGIEYPVMNLGLGVERLAMVLEGYRDIRELVYPQFYLDLKLKDEEIASMIKIDRQPKTEIGKEIARRIIEGGEKYGNAVGPCKFEVFSGKINGKHIRVRIIENEEGKRLLGPAALNEIYVNEGNIYGIPPEKKIELRSKGINCNIRYLDSIALLAAYKIEKGLSSGTLGVKVRVPIVKSLSDINLSLDPLALRYIQGKNKKIDIRGPVFITIEADIS
jgi:O-phosphoseryl-tRNA synthetase